MKQIITRDTPEVNTTLLLGILLFLKGIFHLEKKSSPIIFFSVIKGAEKRNRKQEAVNSQQGYSPSPLNGVRDETDVPWEASMAAGGTATATGLQDGRGPSQTSGYRHSFLPLDTPTRAIPETL